MHKNPWASDPAGGAHDAPPDPLVGLGGGYSLPIPLPARRLRRLELGAVGSQALSTQKTVGDDTRRFNGKVTALADANYMHMESSFSTSVTMLKVGENVQTVTIAYQSTRLEYTNYT